MISDTLDIKLDITPSVIYQMSFLIFGANIQKIQYPSNIGMDQVGWILNFNPILNLNPDAPPSSLCDPKRVQRVRFAKLVRNLVPFPASSTKRGTGVVLEAPGLD